MYSGSFTVDVVNRPRTLFSVFVEGTKQDHVFKAYRIEGDTLRICYWRDPHERRRSSPPDFKPSDSVWTEVFRRKKP